MPGSPGGSPFIVTLADEIDITNAAAAFSSLLAALDTPGLLIADMTGTTFCDSSGLRMLLIAHARAKASTLRIAIKPDGSVARSLAILGMDRMLPVYASVEDATSAQPCAGQEDMTAAPRGPDPLSGRPESTSKLGSPRGTCPRSAATSTATSSSSPTRCCPAPKAN